MNFRQDVVTKRKDLDYVEYKKLSNLEDVDENFLSLLKDQNELLEDVSSIVTIKNLGNYSYDYITHSKILIFDFNLNSVPKINPFFRNLHHQLKDNDCFVGKVELMEANHINLRSKHSRFVYRFLISFEFIFKRLLPRIPPANYFYYRFEAIKKHVLSKCEIMGRIVFNGFDLIKYMEIDENIYFLCRKNYKSVDQKINKSIIFKQKRIGKDGKLFTFFKFRTMHPYAEFLQDYIFENNGLNANGKLKDDFRVADWGIFLRRHWIDELPGLINLFKGNLRFFGVRPLSKHFYSRYPIHLQLARIRNKPGLVPAYYADMPESFDELILSEENYLRRYMSRPFLTDVSYLIKVIRNIVFKGARSS